MKKFQKAEYYKKITDEKEQAFILNLMVNQFELSELANNQKAKEMMASAQAKTKVTDFA